MVITKKLNVLSTNILGSEHHATQPTESTTGEKMNRYPIPQFQDCSKGTWFTMPDEIKPLIACPKCDGWFLGDTATHSIEENGDVNASVVCPYEPCDFHEFVNLVGWSGGKINHGAITAEKEQQP